MKPELPQTSQPKNTRKFLLKTAVSCLLLGYLLYRADFASIWTSMKQASPLWIAVAFSLHIIGFLLTVYRWQMLLAVRGTHLSIRYLLRSLIIGIFFNNFLPSTVGGDVYRAYDTAEHVGSKTEALTIVVVERLTGMFALGLFGVFALFLGFSYFGRIPIIWVALGGLGAAFVIFTSATNPRVVRLIKHVFEHPAFLKIPLLPKIRAKLQQIHGALQVYRQNRRVMFVAFLLALLLQVNVIVHYYCIAYALNLPVPLLYFFLIIPVVTVILMVPVFINGIGGREAAFMLLFSQFGVIPAEAIAFSWISFGMILVQGVIGGIIYAIRKA